MPHAVSEGVRLHFEEAGSGVPILFLHEFAGDHRSWQNQMRHLSRGWRCITFSNRGYPGSDAPEDEAAYGQDIANRDAIAVLDHLNIAKAHVVGLSMGGYTALQLAIHYPNRIIAAVAAGAGAGASRVHREAYLKETLANAQRMASAGRIDAEGAGRGPTRVQLLGKDPIGWRISVDHMAEHDAQASAKTMRRIQGGRPSLYDLEDKLKAVTAPVLLMIGDEDEPCLDVNLFMKRLMPTAQLMVLPGSGHVINHEEPDLFNLMVERFLGAVDRGTWRPRDPRAAPKVPPREIGP
ncbi:MAG: alpha/beta hydrolase [Hyphomicrobiaceae bacterium]|nr:alpha/beta hydrolase [Hyphomicrobiaceae bacterium]